MAYGGGGLGFFSEASRSKSAGSAISRASSGGCSLLSSFLSSSSCSLTGSSGAGEADAATSCSLGSSPRLGPAVAGDEDTQKEQVRSAPTSV